MEYVDATQQDQFRHPAASRCWPSVSSSPRSTPAASVVSLDVVRETPGASGGHADRGRASRRTRRAAAAGAGLDRGRRPDGRRVRADRTRRRARPARSASAGSAPARAARSARSADPRSPASPRTCTGYGAVGVTWAHGDDVADERPHASRSAPAPATTWSDWMDLEYHDEHGPDPDSAEAPARPPRHRRAAGRRGRPGPGARAPATDGLPADMRLAVIDPGTATAPPWSAPRSTPRPWTATDAGDAESTRTTERHRRPDAGAIDLQAATSRRSRRSSPEPSGAPTSGMRDEELAALLRGARRLRPPHGQRQQLHPRRGAGAAARHLRLPHAVPRLVRHRLQLPGRPLRPDLGGPLRRRRPPGRRRPHAQLQRLLVRDVRDRQLRASRSPRRR